MDPTTVADAERFIRALPFRFGDATIRVMVGPLKISVDGGILSARRICVSRTVRQQSILAVYGSESPGHREFYAERIENMMRAAHQSGWQMCSHVTGDAEWT
jgi:predicted amidohydrolase YtcJ